MPVPPDQRQHNICGLPLQRRYEHNSKLRLLTLLESLVEEQGYYHRKPLLHITVRVYRLEAGVTNSNLPQQRCLKQTPVNVPKKNHMARARLLLPNKVEHLVNQPGVQVCEQPEELDKDVQLINSFAERYSLCWSIDIHGILPEIVGQDGASIYVYDEANGGLLGLVWSPDSLTGDQWNGTIRAMIRGGMQIICDAASESYASFCPTDKNQAALAIRICGATPIPDSAAAAQRATMLTTITAARQRKAKQLEHQRVLKELALERAGADLSDYDPTYQPGECRLTL